MHLYTFTSESRANKDPVSKGSGARERAMFDTQGTDQNKFSVQENLGEPPPRWLTCTTNSVKFYKAALIKV